jgi:hypothetical protein
MIHEYHMCQSKLYMHPVYLGLYKSTVAIWELSKNIGCISGRDRQCLDQMGGKWYVYRIFIGKEGHLADLDIASQINGLGNCRLG